MPSGPDGAQECALVVAKETGMMDIESPLAVSSLILERLRGEKLNYKSVAKEISKPPYFWLLKSSGHQSLPCLFDSRLFRTTPIFGMSRDHNRKRLKTRSEWIVFEI